MINIDDVRAFQKVATLLSFSDAARVMNVPRSVVSRSVQRLESVLHVRLLERSTRDVALTETGRTMLAQLSDVLDRVDEAVDMAAILSSHPRGRLRITAGIGFGVEVLTEVLPAFSRDYPDVAVSLDLSSRCADLVAEQVDLAIRMGPLVDSNLVTTRLGALGVQLCATPTYLDAHGRPMTVDDLAVLELLAIPRLDGRPRRWSLTGPDGEERTVSTSPRLSANDPHAVGRMAMHGAGVASFANFIAMKEIAAGRLERVLPDWHLQAVDVSIVMPPGRERNPAVKAFVAFMRDSVAKAWGFDA